MRSTTHREAHEYETEDGHRPYSDWIKSLRDKRAAAKLVGAVRKMEGGNFGDSKPIGEGLSEYRINYGPGYRIYYKVEGSRIIILLCGGDKSTQQVDIQNAQAYWADYQARKQNTERR
ncbi:type II toxin-antitoxin system RelE/ParE family toxin [Sansalvadorimonas verongulae]|uniref:type II toxin-antitoxin system RelE/ParE family toxin n=1 Tax=Sansalvadorimonas verongulae TaxID=2172824 RepID=UPI002E380215|nr:type II toxin-antitoxin system RelE/ParE family toxin [Sansalvadorimonas verongulae]MTI15131.1 type II toxin-antitoxin system RelE/ParE family toxin [Sansalvadorimonas verongulae]